MTERRATIEDVARVAGVSRGTVSRVLNDSPRVSEAARAAVQRAIGETGYRANPHARSLASGRNDTIGVLLTRPHPELFEDPTFSLLLQGISDGLAATDLGLVLLLAGTDDEQRRAARFIDPRHVDGVIHISPLIDDPMMPVCAASGVPVVVCGDAGNGRASSRTWTVGTTDRLGGYEAGCHLREQGATRVAVIAGPERAAGSRDRLLGVRDALGGAFDPDLVEHGDYGRESGFRAMGRLLDRCPDLDGVFCASDRMALGALERMRLAHIDVPGDVLVVGFDDHEIGAAATPALTTVHQPIRRIGTTAVQMLTAALGGENPTDQVFPTHLVVRDSSVRR
ncbi:LacI family DNA-binding transcriptional regulator [Mobilicoccus massiliensis]|uniref:LacI family DNA-binding transcriptional regulator n=1 Tax=Mobilicoccus massiliensis TaxID=1522310 RepID=UPI00058BA706|nr:LacI family DNA-binding transcriptional regulator [Mobilicoccus massiliensis]